MEYKFPAINKAMTEIDGYIAAARAASKASKEATANYRGEMLKNEQKRIYDNLLKAKAKCADAVNAALSEMQRKIDAIAKAPLDASNISPDYAFLSLPVTLTAQQLSDLVKRNSSDVLFVQASNEYAAAHNMDITFETSADVLRRSCNEFRASTAAASTYDDASNLYENADTLSWDILSGLDAIEAADNAFTA